MMAVAPWSAICESRSSRADSGSPSWASPSMQLPLNSFTAFETPA